MDQVSSIDDAVKQHPTTNIGAVHAKLIFKYQPKKKLTEAQGRSMFLKSYRSFLIVLNPSYDPVGGHSQTHVPTHLSKHVPCYSTCPSLQRTIFGIYINIRRNTNFHINLQCAIIEAGIIQEKLNNSILRFIYF